MTNGSLMKVESIDLLSDNLSWKPIFGLLRVAVLHRFYCIINMINLEFPNLGFSLQIGKNIVFSLEWAYNAGARVSPNDFSKENPCYLTTIIAVLICREGFYVK